MEAKGSLKASTEARYAGDLRSVLEVLGQFE